MCINPNGTNLKTRCTRYPFTHNNSTNPVIVSSTSKQFVGIYVGTYTHSLFVLFCSFSLRLHLLLTKLQQAVRWYLHTCIVCFVLRFLTPCLHLLHSNATQSKLTDSSPLTGWKWHYETPIKHVLSTDIMNSTCIKHITCTFVIWQHCATAIILTVLTFNQCFF